jgi:hypothetical protein
MPDLLDKQEVSDFVTTTNDRIDRVFDRLHQLHGENISLFLSSLGRSKDDEGQDSQGFLFHLPFAQSKKQK